MKLLDNIYMVAGGNAGFNLSNDYDCNIYLVDCGDELVLIDAGVGLDIDWVLKNIKNEGFDPHDINHVLLTHAHADHAGGAAELKKILNVKVYLHEAEVNYVENADEEALGLTIAKENKVYPHDYLFTPCKIDVKLKHNEQIKIGNLIFKTIHVPGHSEGSVAYFVDVSGERILFSGDAVFYGGKISLLNCHGSSLADYRKGINNLKGLNIDVLLPSHYTITLNNGQRHIDKVLEEFKGLTVPALV